MHGAVARADAASVESACLAGYAHHKTDVVTCVRRIEPTALQWKMVSHRSNMVVALPDRSANHDGVLPQVLQPLAQIIDLPHILCYTYDY